MPIIRFLAIKWKSGSVEVVVSAREREINFSAPRVLLTLPLGVLQASPSSVHFEPELLSQKQTALKSLAMGKVVRVTLCFRERFWKGLHGEPDSRNLADLSFLFSRDEFFPTWWTQMR